MIPSFIWLRVCLLGSSDLFLWIKATTRANSHRLWIFLLAMMGLEGVTTGSEDEGESIFGPQDTLDTVALDFLGV